MTTFVLDASVAAKWLLPSSREPLAAEATALLDRFRAGEIRVLVPDLFWAELGNILWKSVRLGRCSKTTAAAALESIREIPFPTVPSLSLVEAAFGIASQFGRTVYDALYVALAVESNTQLITADEKLANALAAQLPVKWLGALKI